MSLWDGEDRFSLLLLQDGEYYFKDYSCHYYAHDAPRQAGMLKVCSESLYFVPRDSQEPICRYPFSAISVLERATEVGGVPVIFDDTVRLVGSERTEMTAGSQPRPYVRKKGTYEACLRLVYTSLEEVLPRVLQLWEVARRQSSKEALAAAQEQLAAIIREHEEKEQFNPGWLEEEEERIEMEVVGACITPLCAHPGRVVITPAHIYFQPFNVVSNSPIQTYPLSKVQAIMRRVWQLEDRGLELFFEGRTSLYLTLKTKEVRNRVEAVLLQQPALHLEKRRTRRAWTRDWLSGKVSNFDYLMYLNREAGRSFNDLTQYPIFPWVIQDYTSPHLDLDDPATFRDLAKPIGALSSKRLAEFRARYQDLKQLREAGSRKKRRKNGRPETAPLDIPPFMYGCHYSTPGYVVYYLMRSEPQLMLRLQNGRFDAPDRLFWSVADTWKSVVSLPTDVKELIPEFYAMDPSFLLNTNHVDFGARTSGAKVGDVELPPWASDAQDFLMKLAQALESPLVSRRLHKWINLVFGYKSRGPRSVAADNVFHYLTYDEFALQELEAEANPQMREALRVQMMEFGRTPRKLFSKRHPKRRPPLVACGALRGPPPPALPSSRLSLPSAPPRRGKETAVGRAVARLASSNKEAVRKGTLSWLESTARSREPAHLSLSSHAEILPLLQNFLRQPKEGEERVVLTRALKALAQAPANRVLILEAGGLDPLLDALASPEPLLWKPALGALALLSREEADVRLSALAGAPLYRLTQLLQDTQLAPELRKSAASTLGNLARSPSTRSALAQQHVLKALLQIACQGQEELALRREALAAANALLEDDVAKLQVAEEEGGVEAVVACCGERQLQLGTVFCLASLSMHDRLHAPLARAGAIQVMCSVAESGDVRLQRPAAAGLANLAVDDSLLQPLPPAFLPSLLSLCDCPDQDVQRHAARALWHLTASSEAGHRQQVLEGGALDALLRLAQSGNKSMQAKTLARQALKRISLDSEGRRKLEEASAGGKAGSGTPLAELLLTRPSGTLQSSEASSSGTTPDGTPLAGRNGMLAGEGGSWLGLSASDSLPPHSSPSGGKGAREAAEVLAHGGASGSAEFLTPESLRSRASSEVTPRYTWTPRTLPGLPTGPLSSSLPRGGRGGLDREEGTAQLDPVSLTLSFPSPDKAGGPPTEPLLEGGGTSPGTELPGRPPACLPAAGEAGPQPSAIPDSSPGTLPQALDVRPARVSRTGSSVETEWEDACSQQCAEDPTSCNSSPASSPRAGLST